MEFNLNEAMTNLATVCRNYKGTADEHEYLQKTLQVVYDKLKKLEDLEQKADPGDEPGASYVDQ